jgi:hypothetical protein
VAEEGTEERVLEQPAAALVLCAQPLALVAGGRVGHQRAVPLPHALASDAELPGNVRERDAWLAEIGEQALERAVTVTAFELLDPIRV